jgi:hypothetical protein
MKMIRNRDIAQSEKENNERRKRKTTGALRLDAGCSMSKLQIPTSKLQRSSKLQPPNTSRASVLWSLVIEVSLELGIWSFSNRSTITPRR